MVKKIYLAPYANIKINLCSKVLGYKLFKKKFDTNFYKAGSASGGIQLQENASDVDLQAFITNGGDGMLWCCTWVGCGKAYKSHVKCQSHVRQVHAISAESRTCDICSAEYASVSRMEIHRASHFDGSHDCSWCHARFATMRELRYHEKFCTDAMEDSDDSEYE
jgi:hypothetical protein